MRINQMRERLIGLHPNSRRWRERVCNMPDHQIVAIMIRISLQEKPRNKK